MKNDSYSYAGIVSIMDYRIKILRNSEKAVPLQRFCISGKYQFVKLMLKCLHARFVSGMV
jgi:hypothetical protein